MGNTHVAYNNIFAYARHGPEIIRRRGEGSLYFHQNLVLGDEPTLYGDHWDKENAKIDYNIYWVDGGKPPRFAGKSLKEWREKARDRNSKVAKSKHLNFEAGRRLYDPGLIAEEVGFEAIDLQDVGPRGR